MIIGKQDRQKSILELSDLILEFLVTAAVAVGGKPSKSTR
jgi:hypothetical protein